MSKNHFLAGLLFLNSALFACQKEEVIDTPPVANFSFTTTEIDSTLINPGAGFIRWNGRESAPVPCIDRYARYNWTVFEKGLNQYDFAVLDNEAELARTDPDGKGRFSFAVRFVVENTDKAYPSYLDGKIGAWYSNNKKCWVPDWNDAYLLERLDSLVSKLGQRYNKDPRIGTVEIRSYGNWGEWHLSGFETPPAPYQPITVATKQRMIDMYLKAFPNKQIIMMSDDNDGLGYAIAQNKQKYPVGWRRDSFGEAGMNNITTKSYWPQASDRWKSAPVIIECYGNQKTVHLDCPKQTADFHVSVFSNGNFEDWATLTTAQQNAMLQSAKMAGFRFIPRGFSFPDSLRVGVSNTVKSVWSNKGVSPTYDNWKVVYRLIHPTTREIAWEATSSIDLRKLLPTYSYYTKIDVPITIEDNFTPPTSLARGNYLLELVVVDGDGYFNPLRLAIKGRNGTGGYSIGLIKVGK